MDLDKREQGATPIIRRQKIKGRDWDLRISTERSQPMMGCRRYGDERNSEGPETDSNGNDARANWRKQPRMKCYQRHSRRRREERGERVRQTKARHGTSRSSVQPVTEQVLVVGLSSRVQGQPETSALEHSPMSCRAGPNDNSALRITGPTARHFMSSTSEGVALGRRWAG